MGTARIEDADLYLATVGSRCIGCGDKDGSARLFMPPHPMHLGNIVVLCNRCESGYRRMAIDVFAAVAMAKYEKEEQVFGFRLPVEAERDFELRLARKEAERIYDEQHPHVREIELTEMEGAGVR
jgi:hypothetical protein